MLLILFISIFLCVVSIKNLPLGYILCLLSKLVIPDFVTISFGGISMGFHSFFFIFIILLCISKLKFNVLWHIPIIKVTLIWVLLTIVVGVISRDTPIVYNVKGLLQFVRDYILILVGWGIFKKRKQTEIFFSLLFVITFVSCIYGIYEYISKTNPYMEYLVASFDGVPTWETFHNDVRGVINGRIQSLTNHPLIHGQRMEVIFPFVLIFSKMNKIIGGRGLALLVLVNVVLAGSRASIIATFLFIALMLLNKQNIRQSIFVAISLLFIVFLVGGKLSGEVASTFKNMVFFWTENSSQEIHGSSIASRLLQYGYMVDDLGTKLPIGHGMGYAQYDFDLNGDHPIMHGYESIILKKITEIGIIGFIIYLVWYLKIYLFATTYFKSYNQGKYYREIKYLILTYFVSLLLTGDFGSNGVFFMLILIFYRNAHMSEKSRVSSKCGNSLLLISKK